MKDFQPDARCPLDGIRVLDVSRLVAGNVLSVQLADFGAEVVKIEDPVKGDPLRDWRAEGISLHWKVYGRNKKSVTLNLREREGRDLLLRLVSTAQVFLENFRPGTLETMGLAPALLHERNPKLVIVRLSGWGQDGPYRDRPGFGSLIEGVSGFAAKNGYPDRPPVLPPFAMADMVAGLVGATAVLVALREVEVNGGKGQVIDLPLLDPLISILDPDPAHYRLTGKTTPRLGSRSATSGPRNVFATGDGRFIAISASMQGMAERLFRAVGRPDMVDDPRFRTNTDRVANAEECERPIREFILARTLADALAVFEAAEVTAAAVYDVDQLLDDPHVKAREIIVEVPDADMGTLPMHNVVPRLSETPGALRAPAPELGQHNRELLGALGLSDDDLARLRERKVI
jgi:crotonobetainyl-CoA:carnitine CoA-transferase CaiB-like acyl-CoA transferase